MVEGFLYRNPDVTGRHDAIVSPGGKFLIQEMQGY